jgi:hypothetical protein
VAGLRFNSCPRCKGDIMLGNKDEYGWYEQCLQCGYLRDLEIIARVARQSAAKRIIKLRRLRRITTA